MNSQQFFEDFKRKLAFEEYKRKQREYANQNRINTAKNVVSSLPKTIDNAKKVVDFGKNVSNGLKAGESIGNAVKAASVASKAANAANTASNVANAANTASNVAGAASAASSAMPVVGAVTGAASAANNFSKGNYIDGGLDVAKTGAMFIPGVGWAVAGAIQIGQMIKNAINKKKAKAQQRNMEAMAKNDKLAAEKKQENLAQFDEASQAVNTMPQQSMLASPTSPVDTQAEQNIPEQLETTLPEPPVRSNEVVETSEEEQPSWGQNILDAMNAAQGLGASKDVIDAIPQGLNSGNKDIAALIDKYRVNKPTTPEEIELARAGEFNTPEVEEPTESKGYKGTLPVLEKDSRVAEMMKNIRGGLNNFAEGYKDNAYTTFSEGDLAKGITGAAASQEPKTFMNRLGEVVGTGSRVISNPGLQGLVAGAIKGANTGDWGEGLEYGVNWTANKAKSDNYYKLMNPNAKRAPIFSNYDANDYKAFTTNEYRDTLNEINKMKVKAQLDKTNPTLEDYANTQLHTGEWDLDQYNNFINSDQYKANPYARINLNAQKNNTTQDRVDIYGKDVDSKIKDREVKQGQKAQEINLVAQKLGISAKEAEAKIKKWEAEAEFMNKYDKIYGGLGGNSEVYTPDHTGDDTEEKKKKHRTNAF